MGSPPITLSPVKARPEAVVVVAPVTSPISGTMVKASPGLPDCRRRRSRVIVNEWHGRPFGCNPRPVVEPQPVVEVRLAASYSTRPVWVMFLMRMYSIQCSVARTIRPSGLT